MRKFLFAIVLFTTLFLGGSTVHAASMYIVPDKTQVTENEAFGATVFVNTAGASINNADGIVSFPADSLFVESVNNAGSVFSIWIEQPTFSNTTGTVSFNGGVPNPGYSGTAGKILRVMFRAKKAGVPAISFSNATIRANDGLGTNVDQNSKVTGSASITISGTFVVPTLPQATTPALSLPPSPLITSNNMPNTENWYSIKDALFAWGVPSGVNTVQLLFDRNTSSIPLIGYSPAISTKTVSGLKDGTWYFHVRFKNSSGWGPIAHRKFLIDNTAPTDLEATNTINQNDLIAFSVSAKDASSGIDRYEFYKKDTKLGETKEGSFVLPPIAQGVQNITVKAFDKAGNFIEKIIEVTAPEIKAPKITVYPTEVRIGERFDVSGISSYVNTDIELFVQESGDSARMYTTKSKEDRTFSIKNVEVKKEGSVSMWAETALNQEARSKKSNTENIVAVDIGLMKKLLALVRIGDDLNTLLNKILFIIISLSIILIIGLIVCKRIAIIMRRKQKNIPIADDPEAESRSRRTELAHADNDMHTILTLLKQDIRGYLRTLERAGKSRDLTEEEKHILTNLTEYIEQAEKYESAKKYFAKRIKDME